MTSKPNLVQPESAGELASAETKMTSEPNLVQPESAGELASAETKMTSEPNLVQPESAGELASAETKMTSEPNLVQPESAGELGPVETQATARDSQWVAGVERRSGQPPASRRRPRPRAKIEPVEPKPVGELASEETKMTSKPNLARSEREGEPVVEEKKWRAQPIWPGQSEQTNHRRRRRTGRRRTFHRPTLSRSTCDRVRACSLDGRRIGIGLTSGRRRRVSEFEGAVIGDDHVNG